MKSLKLHILIVALVSFAFLSASLSADEAEEGKKAFLANKCNLCHSVEAAKIEKTTGGYQKGKEKNVPPDLSRVGTNRTADWMKLYLQKKEKNENVAHVRLFKGTETELDAITKWLATLK